MSGCPIHVEDKTAEGSIDALLSFSRSASLTSVSRGSGDGGGARSMLLSLIICQTQESLGKAGLMEPGGFNPFMPHPKHVKYWKNANMNVSRSRNTTAGSLQCNGDEKAMSLCTLQVLTPVTRWPLRQYRQVTSTFASYQLSNVYT